MTLTELFAQGWQHHQADRYPQAEAAFRQVLQADPRHADAWSLFAESCLLQGKFAEAEAGYSQAIRLRSHQASDHINRGVALAQLGRAAEAVASYREGLRLHPDNIDGLSNLGAALVDLDQHDEAIACLRRAAQLSPAAIRVHNNLGRALIAKGQMAQAEACLRQAIRLQPGYAKAHVNLGIALMKLGRLGEAEASLRYALVLEARDANTYNTLGVALKDQGKLAEAVTCLEQAIRLGANIADAHANLGITLMSLGRHDEAAGPLQEALRLKPDFADAHKNLAMVWLQQGNYEQGWREYEWRWYCKEFSPVSFPQARWDGRPLEGRTILVYAEQGLGDTLQFIRYAPLVQQRGGRVLVQSQAALVPLLSRCPGIDQLVARGTTLPWFDVHAALLSLPYLFGTTLDRVPAAIPYLFPDPELVERWRRELAPLPGFKIGISWQGSPGYPGDRERSTRLAYFAPLARLPGVQLFSLQKGPGTEQLAEVAGRFPVTDLGSRLDEVSGPFMDTAALMKSLDLVVSVDTSLSHLAGALGVPVWVAQSFAPDWRWQWGRDSTPWYPTMRFFRQAEWGRWEAVFFRMAEALRARLAT
jgi:tetratricopeptide (TPR) repeat protein